MQRRCSTSASGTPLAALGISPGNGSMNGKSAFKCQRFVLANLRCIIFGQAVELPCSLCISICGNRVVPCMTYPLTCTYLYFSLSHSMRATVQRAPRVSVQLNVEMRFSRTHAPRGTGGGREREGGRPLATLSESIIHFTFRSRCLCHKLLQEGGGTAKGGQQEELVETISP